MPDSFRRLHRLLEEQAYRLAFWRVATEEINYRRFFNINDLAGLRIELPELFEATHRLILGMVERGQVQGLRIDHIDGLFDPARYCATLRRARRRRHVHRRREDPGALRAAARLADRRHDRIRFRQPGARAFRRCRRRGGDDPPLSPDHRASRGFRRGPVRREAAHHACQSGERDERARAPLPSPVDGRLAHPRFHLAQHADRARGGHRGLPGLPDLCLGARAPAPTTTAISTGRSGWPKSAGRTEDTTILDFIHGVLIADLPGHPLSEDVLRVAMQFQQVTGPVMAKAFEDTAFYRYFRLLALNEVGGDPRRFGMSCAAFHHVAAERGQSWPRAMLTTATHDTKRGEDARLRIALLSEMPREWGRRVAGWIRLNRRHRGEIDGEDVPDRNIEYLFYQMLVGAWPPGLDPDDVEAVSALAERVEAAMVKSVREGKERSSWSYPNAAYEAGLHAVRARRARCRQAQPVSRRFRRFCRTAGAAGGDRLAGAARAEADRARRAGHLSGRRAVGFQPRRSRQPPTRRLERTAPPAGQAVRREPRRTGRALAGRTGKTVRDGAAARLAPGPAGAVRRLAITSRSISARAATRIASAPFPAGTATRCWQSPCRG